MQVPSAAQLAAFQPQSAFQDHILPAPDPFVRFLDRSSIYYDTPNASQHIRDIDIPPSLAGFRTIAGGHAHCDWSDTLFLLPQPLQYDPCPMPTTHPDAAHTTTTTPATSSDITQSIRNACANNSRASSSRTSKQEGAGPRPREKKHACWMCEKSFDRPSTLRKHLLVHTGEKAFVCDTCGRRFGVASNLNRHVKRCILKPVNAANRTTQMTTTNTTSTTTSTHPSTSPSIPSSDASPVRVATSARDSPSATSSRSGQKRTRDGDAGPASPPDSPSQSAPKPPAKRRRRAPSPSQWIPQSLADFNITPAEYTKPTPVPLPPVTAYKDPLTEEWIEERNSWDENVSLLPYHPCGWKGTLPGPGVVGGKDVMNLGLVNGGTYVMGRLVMV